jgi:hypothetical protein
MITEVAFDDSEYIVCETLIYPIGNVFTKNMKAYSISEIEQLFGALNYVFHQAELELEAMDG